MRCWIGGIGKGRAEFLGLLVQAFIKSVKSKAYYKRFQTKYRRRRGTFPSLSFSLWASVCVCANKVRLRS